MKKLLTTIGLLSSIFAQDGKLAVSILDFTGEDVKEKFLRACVRRQSLLDTFAFELREYFDVSFCYSFYAN